MNTFIKLGSLKLYMLKKINRKHFLSKDPHFNRDAKFTIQESIEKDISINSETEKQEHKWI